MQIPNGNGAHILVNHQEIAEQPFQASNNPQLQGEAQRQMLTASTAASNIAIMRLLKDLTFELRKLNAKGT
jgi:hypothetical protein